MAREKTPRVSTNPYASDKTPKIVVPTYSVRVPKVAEPLDEHENKRKVRFRFDLIDLDADWSILNIDRDDHRDLMKLFADIEKMTAGELFRPDQVICKSYNDMSLCPTPAVLARLATRYEGLDHMVRLEMGGLRRLYGVRTGHEFHVVWWDPDHAVWPAKLKHT